jgi:hypothetical protein
MNTRQSQICIYICTYINTHAYACMHTHTYIYTYIHTHSHLPLRATKHAEQACLQITSQTKSAESVILQNKWREFRWHHDQVEGTYVSFCVCHSLYVHMPRGVFVPTYHMCEHSTICVSTVPYVWAHYLKKQMCMHASSLVDMSTYVCICIHGHPDGGATNTTDDQCVHAHVLIHIQTHTHTHTYTCMHAYTRAYMHRFCIRHHPESAWMMKSNMHPQTHTYWTGHLQRQHLQSARMEARTLQMMSFAWTHYRCCHSAPNSFHNLHKWFVCIRTCMCECCLVALWLLCGAPNSSRSVHECVHLQRIHMHV